MGRPAHIFQFSHFERAIAVWDDAPTQPLFRFTIDSREPKELGITFWRY